MSDPVLKYNIPTEISPSWLGITYTSWDMLDTKYVVIPTSEPNDRDIRRRVMEYIRTAAVEWGWESFTEKGYDCIKHILVGQKWHRLMVWEVNK